MGVVEAGGRTRIWNKGKSLYYLTYKLLQPNITNLNPSDLYVRSLLVFINVVAKLCVKGP